MGVGSVDPGGAADAPRRPAGSGGSAALGQDDQQPTRLSNRANRLARDFEAAVRNQVWLADLTYIPTGEGWLYLAAILDMHTRKMVGWSMCQTLHTETPSTPSTWPSNASGPRSA